MVPCVIYSDCKGFVDSRGVVNDIRGRMVGVGQYMARNELLERLRGSQNLLMLLKATTRRTIQAWGSRKTASAIRSFILINTVLNNNVYDKANSISSWWDE